MNLRILVVDDDVLMRREIKQMLTHVGHNVDSAESGIKAIEFIKQKDYDLVFLDLKMPNMDGLEVLKVILSLKPKVFVTIITAYATVETAVEAMKLGAYDYIKKPFRPKQLHLHVNKVIEEIGFNKGFRRVEQDRMVQNGYKTFSKYLDSGNRGLCISRRSSDELLQVLNLRDAEAMKDSMFTISESKDNWQFIHPKDIDELEEIIIEFLTKGDGTILFDGLEILIEYNSWQPVRTLLKKITENIRGTTSNLIICLNPSTVTDNDLWELKNLFRTSVEDYVFDCLANSIRRDIVRFLSRVRTASFTTILRGINMSDSPKFTFHLKILIGSEIIEKDPEGRYMLTKKGENLYDLFSNVNLEATEDAEGTISLVLGEKTEEILTN